MRADEFVRRLKGVADDHKTLYVMGCFGAPMNEKNKARYTHNHRYNMTADRVKYIKGADEDTFGFDCVCLIKGILWGWTGDKSKTYGGAVYAANGVPDINADRLIEVCQGVSTDFGGIVPGAVVWMPGHVGVYIGDGLAVECSPKWANGVQRTAVGNLGQVAGCHTRTWKKWGRLPYVTYEEGEEMSREELRELVRQETESLRAELTEQVKVIHQNVEKALGMADGGERTVYHTLEEVPEWGQEAIQSLMLRGRLRGDESGDLRLSETLLRALVILERGERR